MNTTKRLGLLVTALLFGAAACGGDDGSPLAEALAADIVAEEDPITTDPAEAACLADGVVTGVGEDRLEELGMTVDNVGDVEDYDFSEAEVGVVVDSMFDCVDVKASLVSVFEEDFGAEGANCIADALDEETLRTLMSSSIQNVEPSDEFLQQFSEIAVDCGLE